MEKSNGKILISLVAIVILFVAILFTSFAIFAYTKKGIEENKITTGTVSMSFNETPNGRINITNSQTKKEKNYSNKIQPKNKQ